jgi:hypothetical protein
MTTQVVQAVLRGGPSHGLEVTALLDTDPDTQTRAIDCLSRSGYTYRDSGHSLHGLRIYDWLPATRPSGYRSVAPVLATASA